MASEMIERAAAAIKASGNWSGDVDDACRLIARVVIEAMREPTNEMEKAGAEQYGETEGFGIEQRFGLVFGSMIHAALRDDQ